jgi:gluconokinase
MAQVLALDIGSSSVRAQRFDERGNPAGELRQEKYDTNDAAEVADLVRKVLDAEEPDGTSSFGHSLLALDAKGKPLTPILGWRDTRSADAADWLRRRLDADAVHARTGGFLHPSYWAAKLAWLAQVEPDVFREADCFVSFVDYLRGSRETSASLASGTGLLDLTTNDWDVELLDALGVDAGRLPSIGEVPVWLDGACSNLGAGCVGRERAALMIGTSGAVRVLYATERPQPRPGLFVYRVDAARVVEGGALSDGGNLHAWLEKTLTEGGTPREEHGLTFLPFLGGERSTGWDPDATGTIHGLTFTTTAADIRQAALEGVGFRFAAVLDLLPEVEEVVATGGALRRDHAWVQVIADALARPVTLSAVDEASLRGAAVAVLGDVPEAPLARTFHPREDVAERYREARERHELLYGALSSS